MKYAQTWQDFMREPVNKALKESKGIHACKHKYIQEQNKMQWHDPMIIAENNPAGTSVSNNASAAGGNSTSFITGNEAEKTTFSFTAGLAGDFTASYSLAANHGAGAGDELLFFDIEAYDGSTDFTAAHAESMKTFRFFMVSGSGQTREFAPTIPNTIHGVITSSAVHIAGDAITAADDLNITGSVLGQWVRAIKDQLAGSIVGGFTNTIKPDTLFTAITGSSDGAGFLQVTNKYRGSVANATIGSGWSDSPATASIATSTAGTSTWFDDQGALEFDGDQLPFSNYPHKDDGMNTTSQPT